MANQFEPTALGGSLIQKTQKFMAGGTFYPTQGLLDAGGIVDLDIRGGGGGGSYYAGNWGGGTGGSSKHVIKHQITSLAPITVTVGTGGTSTNVGASATGGGSSSFGSITVSGGGVGASGGGAGTGNEGRAGVDQFFSTNYTFSGATMMIPSPNSTDQGSGAGGGGGYNGRDGSVTVTWWEKV